MSKEGISKFAEVMSIMQQARCELLRLGTKTSKIMGSVSGKQDIQLARLLGDAKDRVKEEFCKITMQEYDANNNGSRCSSRKGKGRKGR